MEVRNRHNETPVGFPSGGRQHFNLILNMKGKETMAIIRMRKTFQYPDDGGSEDEREAMDEEGEGISFTLFYQISKRLQSRRSSSRDYNRTTRLRISSG